MKPIKENLSNYITAKHKILELTFNGSSCEAQNEARVKEFFSSLFVGGRNVLLRVEFVRTFDLSCFYGNVIELVKDTFYDVTEKDTLSEMFIKYMLASRYIIIYYV